MTSHAPAATDEGLPTRRGPVPAIATALAWVVVGVLGAVVLVAVVVPRLAGAQTYTILTGSMQPELSPGSVVVVRPTAVEDVGLGDVVTYQLESGRSATVTHRVVGLTVGPDGDERLVTQGDAGGAPDAEPVRGVQVRGVVWYDVPWVGGAAANVGADARTGLSRLAAAALFGYAGFVLVLAHRDRRRARVGAVGTGVDGGTGETGRDDDEDPWPWGAP